MPDKKWDEILFPKPRHGREVDHILDDDTTGGYPVLGGYEGASGTYSLRTIGVKRSAALPGKVEWGPWGALMGKLEEEAEKLDQAVNPDIPAKPQLFDIHGSPRFGTDGRPNPWYGRSAGERKAIGRKALKRRRNKA